MRGSTNSKPTAQANDYITALELLGGHHLKLIVYCNACYGQALDNVESIDEQLKSIGNIKFCSKCYQ